MYIIYIYVCVCICLYRCLTTIGEDVSRCMISIAYIVSVIMSQVTIVRLFGMFTSFRLSIYGHYVDFNDI